MTNFTIESLTISIINEINEMADRFRNISGVSDKSIYYINQNEFGGTERTMEIDGRICNISILYDNENKFITAKLFKNGNLTITVYSENGTVIKEKTMAAFCKYGDVKRLANRLSNYIDNEGIVNDLFENAIDNSGDYCKLQKFERKIVNDIISICDPESERNKTNNLYEDRLNKYINNKHYRDSFFYNYAWHPEIKNEYIREEIEEKAIAECKKILAKRA